MKPRYRVITIPNWRLGYSIESIEILYMYYGDVNWTFETVKYRQYNTIDDTWTVCIPKELGPHNSHIIS